MRCPRHNLALASDGTCIRCRREDEEVAAALPRAPDHRDFRRAWTVAGLLVALGVCAGVVVDALRDAASPPRARPSPGLLASHALPSASAPLLPLAPAASLTDPSPSPAQPGAPTPLERAAHQAQITLYCRPAADCTSARAWLLDRGYVYAERNVDLDTAAAAALRRADPAASLPAFDIDGQVVAGFDPVRLARALDYAGARRLQR